VGTPVTPRILFLRKAPQDREHRALAELYSGLARHTGLGRFDVRVETLIADALPKDREPKPAEVGAALPRLYDILESGRPDILVTVGATATKAVLGPSNMAYVHGIPHAECVAGRDLTVFPMYDPAAGLGNKGFQAAIHYDLSRLGALLRGELPCWAPGPPVVAQWLTAPLGGPKSHVVGDERPILGLDCEGWPERPWGLQFCVDGTTGWVVRADDRRNLAWFNEWHRQFRVFLHNGIGDLPTLRAMGIELEAFEDTQLLLFHHMLHTGSGVLDAEAQNLGAACYRFNGITFKELKDVPGVDLAAMQLPYNAEMLAYAGLDAVAEYRLGTCLWNWSMDVPGVQSVYRIDHGQAFLIRAMMDAGLPFDYEAVSDYYLEATEKEVALRAELEGMAAKRGVRSFNPASAPQVRELVVNKYGLRIRKRTKGGAISTNEKALSQHAAHPFVAKMQEHRELKKLLGTYLTPLMEELAE
jgi:uracil-DNA glycosylase family 4